MRGLIEVRGRPVWHEVVGTGPPLVLLLHGGLSGASSWEAQTDPLAAAGYRVFVPERRGHDVAEPLTYAGMAGDTITYLDQVVRDPAPLIGWSDGAVVALLVALRRPDLVSRLVLIGHTEPELDLAQLAGVRAPALVLQGDRDDVRLEHSAAVVAALPHGRLAVLPGSHMLPIEQPSLVNALLINFLRDDPGVAD